MDDRQLEAPDGRIGRLVRLTLILLALGGAAAHAGLLSGRLAAPPVADVVVPAPAAPIAARVPEIRRAVDEAGLLDPWTLGKFEQWLRLTDHEVGADIRIQLLPEVPGGDLEAYGLRQMRLLAIGRAVNQRGVLFVYDQSVKRLRIEVGPGLEGVLPDGFVG